MKLVNVQAIIESQDRVAELGFAKRIARAKAQMILDMVHNDEPGDRHVRLRIPGTSRVKDIVYYECDDEIMEWNLDAAESRKALKHDTMVCMVQPTWIRTVIKFLPDTGCGHDLTSEHKVERHDLES